MPVTIKGMMVQELHDNGDLYVQVVLNNDDDDAKQQNIGKSQPIMLRDVTSKSGVFPNAIIVDSGSVIKFMVKSQGPSGYGFRIKTDAQAIVDKLYCLDKNRTQKPIVDSVRRFQTSNSLIRVDDWKSIGLDTKEEQNKRWSCRITSWKVYGFLDVEEAIYYGLARDAVEANVKGAATYEWKESSQKFTKITSIYEDDPDTQNNGYLHLYFFVFSDPEEKNRFFELYEAPSTDGFE